MGRAFLMSFYKFSIGIPHSYTVHLWNSGWVGYVYRNRFYFWWMVQVILWDIVTQSLTKKKRKRKKCTNLNGFFYLCKELFHKPLITLFWKAFWLNSYFYSSQFQMLSYCIFILRITSQKCKNRQGFFCFFFYQTWCTFYTQTTYNIKRKI